MQVIYDKNSCGDAPLQVPPFKTIVIFSTSTYGGYKRYCRVRVITIYRRHSIHRMPVIHRIRRNKLYNLTPPFLYPLPTADISKGGIVSGDPPQAELSAATRHRRNCLRRYATGGIVCGDTPQAELSVATRHRRNCLRRYVALSVF